MLKQKTKNFWKCDVDYGLTIYEQKDTNKLIVVITELPGNLGPTVINMYEQLATKTYQEKLKNTPVNNIIWIKHFLHSGIWEEKIKKNESYDLVNLKWNGHNFSSVNWKPIGDRSKQAFEMFLNNQIQE